MTTFVSYLWSAVIPTMPLVPGYGPVLLTATAITLLACVVFLWHERDRKVTVRTPKRVVLRPAERYATR